MRQWVLEGLMDLADNPLFVFLTGDLGFNFLEPLQQKLGPRFINTGIAEQNMVSVAAGLSRQGMRVFCYSISPFLYARAFEQIRVDIALNQLPVQMIGSGAGFDYGSMGPEHHALEDYGVLLGLKNMTVFTPWCKKTVRNALLRMGQSRRPSYLRLDRRGLGELEFDGEAPEIKDWHQVLPARGSDKVFLCVGSSVIPFVQQYHKKNTHPALWVLARLPFENPPDEFVKAVQGRELIVIEEHVRSGGIGEKICAHFYNQSLRPQKIEIRAVTEVFSGLFGDRDFHWEENGLLPKQVCP